MNRKGFTPFRDVNSRRRLVSHKIVKANEKIKVFPDKLCPDVMSERSLTGFTLVELMVTIIILSIFVLSVGMMLTSSWRFWNSGWGQVEVQRDASYAFARIERIVRSGSSASVLGGGLGLQVIGSGITHLFQLNGSVLQLITGGNTETLASGVSSISFSTSGDTVLVNLTLLNGSSSTDFRTTILLRNSS